MLPYKNLLQVATFLWVVGISAIAGADSYAPDHFADVRPDGTVAVSKPGATEKRTYTLNDNRLKMPRDSLFTGVVCSSIAYMISLTVLGMYSSAHRYTRYSQSTSLPEG